MWDSRPRVWLIATPGVRLRGRRWLPPIGIRAEDCAKHLSTWMAVERALRRHTPAVIRIEQACTMDLLLHQCSLWGGLAGRCARQRAGAGSAQPHTHRRRGCCYTYALCLLGPHGAYATSIAYTTHTACRVQGRSAWPGVLGARRPPAAGLGCPAPAPARIASYQGMPQVVWPASPTNSSPWMSTNSALWRRSTTKTSSGRGICSAIRKSSSLAHPGGRAIPRRSTATATCSITR